MTATPEGREFLRQLRALNPPTFLEARRAADKRYLIKILRRCHWNITQAAVVADVDRANLYRLMGRHGIRRPSLKTHPTVRVPKHQYLRADLGLVDAA
jgi:transcriptional regulator of acetoin/glycerol metabolism